MARCSAVLAIDQGTTSTRALRLEPDGQSSIRAAIEHQQIHPQTNWVEHDPLELMRNIETCLDAAGAVGAVAIDNQGESCLAWDTGTKEPLSSVIGWQDSRTQSVVDRLKADGAEGEILGRSGLPLDSYFSASKLAWLFNNVGDAKSLLKAGRLRLGTTDAFFLDRLTGQCVTDITTASRTSLMALVSGTWDPELCRLFGVPMAALPEIVDTTGDFGNVAIDGARVPVTVSIVDQQAALYGHGCRAAGDAKVTFGTGAFALTVTGDSPMRAPEKGLLPTVAWRKVGESACYALDGGVYSAGAAVDWARTLGLFKSFEQINSFDGPPAIARGVAFVPALSGLACPHWDRRARGVWLGLSLETTPLEMVRAVLEGIAFRTGQVIEAMHALVPIRGELSIDGGLSSNPYFTQFLANALERPILVSQEGELTALGAARLAAETLSFDLPDVAPSRLYGPHEPQPEGRARFAEACQMASAWPHHAPQRLKR